MRSRWLALGQELEALPTDVDSFGLIHNDLHPQNFLVDGRPPHGDRFRRGRLSLVRHRHGHRSLSCPVARRPSRRGARALCGALLGRFLAGYAQENRLAPEWLARLPLFLSYRRILLYIVFTDADEAWFRGQAAKWRADILADRPVVAWHYEA